MGKGGQAAPPTPRRRQGLRSTRGLFALAVVTFLSVLVVAVAFVVAESGSSRPDEEFQARLLDRLDEAAAGEPVRIAAVTDFEWDTVGVFGPYQSRDDVAAAMGVPVPRGVTNWLHDESSCLLVFRNGSDLVAWSVLPRDRVTCGSFTPSVASPSEARLSPPAGTG